ncbi:glycosyl transferase family protein [Sphingomonas sp.]|uniref:glycosyl transferase family protein n=1 Tax=Sphingomonas sp. TaxID=28214 RepID=UPI003B007BDC
MVLDAAARELALFAAVGFLIGGLDDLCIDLIWLARTAWRRITVYRRHPRATAATLASPKPGRLAIFVPAWREDAVIGQMISRAKATLRHRDWVLYVGCYPNDPATIAAVEAATRGDERVRLVIGDAAGPTTKAGCLNWLWQAMRVDEATEHRHVKAVILHDAEDAVHRDELAVYDALIDRFDLVQLPVAAVPVSGRGWWAALVSGSYCGEFAEAHGKQVVVREAVGAAVPSAGVGCAIGRRALAQAARGRDGPFDPGTLTEDYELGLRIGAAGGRGAFVRVRAADGDGIVAVRACFPETLPQAARQKARWITGIALAGWDRLGWEGGLAERWMRLRDRRTPIAAMVLAAAYAAVILWGIEAMAGLLGLAARPTSPLPPWTMWTNLGLVAWRAAWRAAFTGRACGWRMALLTVPHMVVGNLVAMAAAVRAIGLYVGIVRSGRVRWDKTVHVFPA